MIYDILVYLGDSTHKKESLEKVLTTLHYSYLIVEDSALYESVGYLFNLFDKPANKVGKPASFAIDLIIFNEISDEKIMEINTRLKETGIEIKCKAMLTQHNIHWTLTDLLAEIKQEHKYFTCLEDINNMLISSSSLIIEHYTAPSWKAYEKAFYEAYECLQTQAPLEVVEMCLAKLKQAKKQLIRIENGVS